MTQPYPQNPGPYYPAPQHPGSQYPGPARPLGPEPSPLQRAMAGLVWPMLFIGTLWMAMGHVFLAGGDGGWMVFIHLLFFAPVVGTVLLVHAILVTIYARKSGRWAVGPQVVWISLALYLLTVVYPFFVEDFGDSGPAVHSLVTSWFGIPSEVSGVLMGLTVLAWILCAVVLIIFDAVDLSRINRAVAMQRGPQYYPPVPPR